MTWPAPTPYPPPAYDVWQRAAILPPPDPMTRVLSPYPVEWRTWRAWQREQGLIPDRDWDALALSPAELTKLNVARHQFPAPEPTPRNVRVAIWIVLAVAAVIVFLLGYGVGTAHASTATVTLPTGNGWGWYLQWFALGIVATVCVVVPVARRRA